MNANTFKAALAAAGVLAVLAVPPLTAASAQQSNQPPASAGLVHTATPIKHLVVIFQENVSFDHSFGTYPNSANTGGQPFTPLPGTPSVNGLNSPAPGGGTLLTNNPNGANPRRYDPANVNDLLTCDQDHDYYDEQEAFDNGLMDKFPGSVGTGSPTKSPEGVVCNSNDVMNYYDGNTVTALWNYAQHYAMSDNSYGTTFGPSSPGAINLASGDTGGAELPAIDNGTDTPSIASASAPNNDLTPDGQGGYSLTSDAQPYWDDCSTRDAAQMSGKNIGDELNTAGLSWGWFEGGFRPTTTFADAATATGNAGQSTATFIPDEFKAHGFNSSVPHSSNQGICDAVHPVGAGLPASLGTGTGQYKYKDDYIPHHEPFQYYASTANPHHLTIPTDGSGSDTVAGLRTIGTDTQSYVNGVPQFDTPNHQYDTSDFDQLVAAINRGDLPPSALPAVSFLKAPGYEDGHAAYSDPVDEQQFIVHEINALQQSPDWKSTAVVIAYDDSDGWYDHQASTILNPGNSAADTPMCSTGGNTLGGQDGRCGYGPRLPLLVISSWAKSNVVDHTRTDQSSIIRFVEDNWGLPRIAGSFDSVAGSLDGMFDFGAKKGQGNAYGNAPNSAPLMLDPTTGQPTG